MFKFLQKLFSGPATTEYRDNRDTDYWETVDTREYKQFSEKVAGISYSNPDGSSRAEIAKSCSYGQKLKLVREPDNDRDPNAIKVLTENDEQIGYLSSHFVKEVKPVLKGTAKIYSHIEVFFVKTGLFDTEDGREMPYCKICIRKYYKEKQ